MILISTHDFIIDEKASSNKLKYPTLANGFYTFSVECNSNRYLIKIAFNIFTESVDISIMDANSQNVAIDIPYTDNKDISYLIGHIDFNNYKLLFNKNQNRFEFYQND